MEDDRLKKATIDKIRKLLRIKEDAGATAAEAIQAAASAQRLMAKYHLDSDDLREEPDGVVVASSSIVNGAWVDSLADAVANAFRCRFFIRFVKYRTSKRIIQFVGRESDTAAAIVVFERLYKMGNRLARKAVKDYHDAYPWVTARGVSRSVCEGFVAGVRKELEKQSAELMITTPAEVIARFEELAKGLKTHKVRWTGFDAASYADGVIQGRDAVRSGRLDGQKGLPSYS